MKFTLFRSATVSPKKARSIAKLRSKFARRRFVHGWVEVNEPFSLNPVFSLFFCRPNKSLQTAEKKANANSVSFLSPCDSWLKLFALWCIRRLKFRFRGPVVKVAVNTDRLIAFKGGSSTEATSQRDVNSRGTTRNSQAPTGKSLQQFVNEISWNWSLFCACLSPSV